jgi:hypothetical protein
MMLREFNFTAWTKPGRLRYTFSGIALDDATQLAVEEVCTQLLNFNAVEPDHAYYVSPELRSWRQALDAMMQRGYVARCRHKLDQWYFTVVGLRSLEFGHTFGGTMPLCEPRANCADLPLEDLTNFELLEFFSLHDWDWRPLLAVASRPSPFEHKLDGGDKLWYGGFERKYLLALHYATENKERLLARGVTGVLHNASQKYYDTILKHSKSDVRYAIGDIEPDVASNAEGSVDDGDAAVAGSEAGESSVSIVEALAAMMDDMPDDDPPGDDSSRHSSQWGGVATPRFPTLGLDAHSPPISDADISDDAASLDLRAFGNRSLALLPDDPDILAVVLDAFEPDVAKKLMWGVFLFTYSRKKNGTCCWQVTCPFHKYSAKTLCKKTRNVGTHTADEHKKQIYWLKFWAAQCTDYNRQQLHIHACEPAYDDVPQDDVINAFRIDEWPTEVVDDLTLDGLLIVEGVDSDGELAAAGPPDPDHVDDGLHPGRGRGRGGGRKGRGRGRHGRGGKGKGKASEEHSSTDMNASSSSESNPLGDESSDLGWDVEQ